MHGPILYIGGMKSGKSRLAEARALDLAGDARPLYVATTEICDPEMARRVDLHRTQRGERFDTREEPLDLAGAVEGFTGIVLVECLSVWLNNMLYHERPEAEITPALDALCDQPLSGLVLVINDVGGGVVPDNALARRFADLNGLLAQRLAARADEVHHCIAGIGNRIK